MFKDNPTSVNASLKSWSLTCLLVLVYCVQSSSQDRYAAALITNHPDKNLLRSEDVGFNQSSTHKPYILYGNDLQGPNDFYVLFNLDDRQTVRYELVDIMGKQLTLQELPDVLDQIYKIEVNDVCGGVYIVRLLIDHQYYAEKIYFNP